MFRLKELREENGLKRSELARDLKINAGTIANYENEIREAPYEYLILFSNYFNVTLDYLLGREPYEGISMPLAGALNSNERKLISNYRQLDYKGKDRVLEYIELWKHKQIYD